MADVAEKKDKKSAPEVEERLPRSLLFDLGESVPFWAILGGLLWFNNSAKGKSFYNALWKAHPTDEDLAGKMYRGITGAVSAPIFFGFILFYTFIDFAKPKLLYDTRIQPRPPPGWKAYAKTLFWVMLYQTLITGPLSKVYFAIWKKRGGMKTIRTIPSPLRTILEFLSLEAAFEVGFYLSHRLWAYIGWRLLETNSAHSGYHLPFMPGSTFHGYHHAAFEGNYGANCGILLVDHILGTSKNYEKWLMKYRQAHTNGQIDRTQAAKDIAELEIASEEQAI